LSNAAKFSPPHGEVIIQCSTDDRFATVRIRDHGPGIPAELRPRLFQRFAQAAGNTRRGTGLGLYITRAIVQQLGGEIGFETDLNPGTCFWVKLPLSVTPN
jgi:signal transduction histidine kinase